MASIRKIRAAHLRRMPRVLSRRKFYRACDDLQDSMAEALISLLDAHRKWPQALADSIASAFRTEVLSVLQIDRLAGEVLAEA